MSDKRFRPKVCGFCARIDEVDLGRRFCPTTANRIYRNKPADSCPFFIDDGFGRERKNRRKEDVFEE